MSIRTNPQSIAGNWDFGIALDLHTTSSKVIGTTPDGHPEFENTYSEIGKLLNRLKYQHDQGAAKPIIEAAVAFLRPHLKKIDIIIPVPPSVVRGVQPVLVLARGIAAGLALPLRECLRKARQTSPLKGIRDPDQRRKEIRGAFVVDASHTAGKNVLIFDDLFSSGATLSEITDVLKRQGGVASVRVLTITRTRTEE